MMRNFETNLTALRLDYSQRGLTRVQLLEDPIAQFNAWLAEAIHHELLEPNAMTLSTLDEDGKLWSRTVLLKGVSPSGFTFFTNYEGGKARHLAANPRCALTFWWGPLERQVNISGRVEKTTQQESEDYFRGRPRASQLGAWASKQSEVVRDRSVLEQRFAEADARFAEGEIPLPPFWGGFRVIPETIEFWQGRRSRLHDRFRFNRCADGTWLVERLSP